MNRFSSPNFFNTDNFESEINSVHTGRLPLEHFITATADICLNQPTRNHDIVHFVSDINNCEYKICEEISGIKKKETTGANQSFANTYSELLFNQLILFSHHGSNWIYILGLLK